jgi:hypothetical protein
MKTLQEYDLEIKISQIVIGKGLCKLVINSTNTPDEDSNLTDQGFFYQNDNSCVQISPDSWYADIKYFLVHGTSPQHLDMRKKESIKA